MATRDYTTEEMATLAKYEKQLHSATYSRWCQAMPMSSVKEIYDIHVSATGWNERMNASCSQCVLTLMRAVGTKYYEQKLRTPDIKVPVTPKTVKRAKINTKK